MPSTTSLLKTAQATQKKILEQQDAQIAFDWSQSAKTYQDLVSYTNYLNDRKQKSAGDPSALLTLDKTKASARRGYVSNEIQRQNIDVIEGRSTNQDKYQKLVGLFYQAIDNNDYDLAQSLNLQLDNLSVRMQNEEEQRVRSLYGSGGGGTESVDKMIKRIQKEVLSGLQGTDKTPLSAASDVAKATAQAIINRYNDPNAPQDEIDKLEEKYGAGLSELYNAKNIEFGGKKLSIADVIDAADNEKINNPVYGLSAEFNPVTGKTDYKLNENAVSNLEYTRQYDEQGKEYLTPTSVRTDQNSLFFGQSDTGRGVNAEITNEGSVIGEDGSINLGTGKATRDEGQTIGNRLKSFGIESRQDGTTLLIKLPGENVERRATIQNDGSIRFQNNDGQIVEVGLVDRNLGTNDVPALYRAGQQRIVDPDETSDFAQGSEFGGYLSQASPQGKEYVRNYLGFDTVDQLKPVDLRSSKFSGVSGPSLVGAIGIGNDFTGRGAPVTSALLQSANFTQRNVQAELQAKAEAVRLQAEREATQRLQAAQVFNLNQTPVQQLTAGGVMKRQLQVQALPPAPRVYVAPAPAAPRVTVTPGGYSGRVSVGSGSGLQGY